jgi:uncharacterized protein (DUF849 family)
MKPDVTSLGKVVITVATTGGLHGKEANPALPEQPKDIVQSMRDCYNAGASIAHIDARDKAGLNGVLAVSNAQFVERAIRIPRELGREIATPEEARGMIGDAGGAGKIKGRLACRCFRSAAQSYRSR